MTGASMLCLLNLGDSCQGLHPPGVCYGWARNSDAVLISGNLHVSTLEGVYTFLRLKTKLPGRSPDLHAE